MKPDYYDTTEESGQELINSIIAARSQKAMILSYLKSHPYQSFSPDDIKDILFAYDDTPITSIRARMTTLAIKGEITKNKAEYKKMGKRGKETYTWCYIPKSRIAQQGSLF